MNKTHLAATGLIALSMVLSANAATDDGQLTIWINGDKGYQGLAEVGQKFEDATGVKVIVSHPDDVDVAFQQSAAVGNGPDIVVWTHDRFGEWAKSGLIVPVTPSAVEKAKFEDLAWDAMRVDGKYYGYPIAIEALSLIYNQQLVAAPPQTFEEIDAVDDILQRVGKRAISWPYTAPYFCYPLLAAGGGYAFKPHAGGYDVKDTGINNSGAVAGIQFLAQQLAQGRLPFGEDQQHVEDAFARGELAMMINGPSSWGKLDRQGLAYGVAPLPTLHGHPARAFVGVLAAAINAASPNRGVAVKFLEQYLLTDVGLGTVNRDKPLGAVALRSFQRTQETDPRIQATLVNARNGEPMPSVPEMIRFWLAFDWALQEVSKQQPVEKVLDEAARRIVQ